MHADAHIFYCAAVYCADAVKMVPAPFCGLHTVNGVGLKRTVSSCKNAF